jgi:hypothetical protein
MDELGLPISEYDELRKILDSEKEFLDQIGGAGLDMSIRGLSSYEINTHYDILFEAYNNGLGLLLRLNELENYRRTKNYENVSSSIKQVLGLVSARLNGMLEESIKRAFEGDPVL